jgi:vacuolar-type H+-ATPase subunit E/Vma4
LFTKEAEEKAKSIVTRAEETREVIKKEIEEAKNDLRDRKQSITESEERL